MVYLIPVILFIFLVLFIRFWKIGVRKESLTVLMYHQIDLTRRNSCTVTVSQFEQQLNHLIDNEFEFITAKELRLFTEGKTSLPLKSVLVTFDDCYISVFKLALPLLFKYKIRAVFFIPTLYVNGIELKDKNSMSLENLKELVNQGHEIALHSHSHPDFNAIEPEEIKRELELNINYLENNAIPYEPVLAYPYGSRPRSNGHYIKMRAAFKELGIKAGFRIGNRINEPPFDPFEISRLDINGSTSFARFKLKTRWGKLF